MGFGSVSSRGPNNRLKITVPYSEEYERLGAGRTVCLVRASGAAPILTNGVVFSEAPTEGSSFFYTFDGKSADESGALEGENVTGIWLRIKGQNCATTIIVR